MGELVANVITVVVVVGLVGATVWYRHESTIRAVWKEVWRK